jgi:ABC-type amino acid transport substrate-binding protein
MSGVKFGLHTVAMFVVLSVLALAAPLADEPDLRLASDLWPPFTDEDGRTRLALSLVHKALERSGVAAGTDIVEWREVIEGLQDGSFDGSAAIWRSPEREEYLLYSEPYLENRLVVVGRKGSVVRATRLADLAGKRVAIVAQYAYGDEVDSTEAPVVVDGTSDQANLQKLLRGDVDYMLVDELLIRHLAEHQQAETARLLEIGRTPLVRRTLHLAVRRDLPNAESIVESFDREVVEMIADGTYNVILSLAWIRADVDGDGVPELVPRTTKAGASPPTSDYTLFMPRGESKLPKLERYWFDGQVYQSWDDVPERYKSAPDPADEAPRAFLRF